MQFFDAHQMLSYKELAIHKRILLYSHFFSSNSFQFNIFCSLHVNGFFISIVRKDLSSCYSKYQKKAKNIKKNRESKSQPYKNIYFFLLSSFLFVKTRLQQKRVHTLTDFFLFKRERKKNENFNFFCTFRDERQAK